MKKIISLILIMMICPFSALAELETDLYEIRFFEEYGYGKATKVNNFHVLSGDIFTVINPNIGEIFQSSERCYLHKNNQNSPSEKMLWFYINNKGGAIDEYGKIVVPFEYDYVDSAQDGIRIAIKDGFYGGLTTDGKPVIDFKFTVIKGFVNGYAYAEINKKEMIIDKQGNPDLRYDRDFSFMSKFKNGFSFVRKGGVFNCDSGVEPAAEYVLWNRGFEGDAKTAIDNLINGVLTGYAIIDENGNIIIDDLDADLTITHKVIETWSVSFPEVFIAFRPSYFNEYGVAVVKKNGMFGIINTEGEIIHPFNMTDCKFEGSFIAGALSRSEKILFDRYGNKMDEGPLHEVFSDTLALVTKQGEKWLIDHDFTEIMPVETEYIKLERTDLIASPLFRIGCYEKYGFRSVGGEVNIPPLYTAINLVYENISSYAEVDGLFKLVTAARGELKYCLAKNADNMWGVIDLQNNVVIPFEYDAIEKSYHGYRDYLKLKKGDKIGFSDFEGNIIVPAIYDQIKQADWYYCQGTDNIIPFRVSKGGKWGLAGSNSMELIPCEADVLELTQNFALTLQDNNYYIYDLVENKKIKTGYTADKCTVEWMPSQKYLVIWDMEHKKLDIADLNGNVLFKDCIRRGDNFCIEADDEIRYFNFDKELNIIYMYSNNGTYDAKGNLIANTNLNSNGVKFLYQDTYSDRKNHFYAVYKKPVLNDIPAENYMYMTLDTPFININGEIELIEEDNWFLKPFIENERTLIPLRRIFEGLGADISWDEKTNTVTAIRDNLTLRLTIDSDKMFLNDNAVSLDAPAKIIKNRTFIPLRAVSEAFGAYVDWDEKAKSITITYE